MAHGTSSKLPQGLPGRKQGNPPGFPPPIRPDSPIHQALKSPAKGFESSKLRCFLRSP